MERMKTKLIVVLSLISLSATAQTEYSGIGGASPHLVKERQKAEAKKHHSNSTKHIIPATPVTSTAKPITTKKVEAVSVERRDSGETEVKDGLRTMSRGIGRVVKREVKTMGEVTRKIGEGGKKFFKKLGKGISDSFKKDSIDTK